MAQEIVPEYAVPGPNHVPEPLHGVVELIGKREEYLLPLQLLEAVEQSAVRPEAVETTIHSSHRLAREH